MKSSLIIITSLCILIGCSEKSEDKVQPKNETLPITSELLKTDSYQATSEPKSW